MNCLSLDGPWTLSYGPQRPGGPRTPQELAAAGWPTVDAVVPGNVELDLMRAGVLPELHVANNIYLLRRYEDHQWWYRRTFAAPGEKGVRNLLPERPFGCSAQKVPDPFFSPAARPLRHLFYPSGLPRAITKAGGFHNPGTPGAATLGAAPAEVSAGGAENRAGRPADDRPRAPRDAPAGIRGRSQVAVQWADRARPEKCAAGSPPCGTAIAPLPAGTWSRRV